MAFQNNIWHKSRLGAKLLNQIPGAKARIVAEETLILELGQRHGRLGCQRMLPGHHNDDLIPVELLPLDVIPYNRLLRHRQVNFALLQLLPHFVHWQQPLTKTGIRMFYQIPLHQIRQKSR